MKATKASLVRILLFTTTLSVLSFHFELPLIGNHILKKHWVLLPLSKSMVIGSRTIGSRTSYYYSIQTRSRQSSVLKMITTRSTKKESSEGKSLEKSQKSSDRIIIWSHELEAEVSPLNPWHDLCVKPAELRPSATLTNGQCFNWMAVERRELDSAEPSDSEIIDLPSKKSAWGVHNASEWLGVINQTAYSIRETPTTTLFRILSNDTDAELAKETLYNYFQLNIPLEPLYREWSKQDTRRMAIIADRIQGCRILRQDPVECLFSFICSSNNNIPRITKILRRFREEYGNKVVEVPARSLDSIDTKFKMSFHSFPRLDQFISASEQDFRDMGLGYRAKYFNKTRDLLMECGGENYLLGLREKDEQYVQEELIKLYGIGRKVSDCVALFSLDSTRAIPVDVHVQNIACRDYNSTFLDSGKSLTPKVYKAVGDIFRERFPSYSGWAHSLLFVAELPSFRAALPVDMVNEMDEWRRNEQKKNANKRQEGKSSANNSSELNKNAKKKKVKVDK